MGTEQLFIPNSEAISVYILLDLSRQCSMSVYVGITSKPLATRLKQHLTGLTRRTPKTCWIKSLLASGLSPSIHLLEVCDTWEAATEREKYWIRHLKECGYAVKNSTLGGEGVYGIPLTEEHKRKIAAAGCGRSPSKETREKLRAQRLGMKLSQETKRKISVSRAKHPGQPHTEFTKQKLRTLLRGVKRSGISVMHIPSGQLFNSIDRAAAAFGIRPARLAIDLRLGYPAEFRYVNYTPQPVAKRGLKGRKFRDSTRSLMSKNSAWKRSIRHRASGRIYPSITAAALASGMKPKSLATQLSRRKCSEFEYSGEGNEHEPTIHPRANKDRVPRAL